LTLGTYSGRGHLRRIEGRTLGDHLAAIKRYWNAVADLLSVRPAGSCGRNPPPASARGFQ
jgi:hypothetical protein